MKKALGIILFVSLSTFAQNSGSNLKNYTVMGLSSVGLIASHYGLRDAIKSDVRGFFTPNQYHQLILKYSPHQLAEILALSDHAIIQPYLLQILELETEIEASRKSKNHSHQIEVQKRKEMQKKVENLTKRIAREQEILKNQSPQKLINDRMIERIGQAKEAFEKTTQEYRALLDRAKLERMIYGTSPAHTHKEILEAREKWNASREMLNRKVNDFYLRTYKKLASDPNLRAPFIAQKWNQTLALKYGGSTLLGLFSAGILIYQIKSLMEKPSIQVKPLPVFN